MQVSCFIYVLLLIHPSRPSRPGRQADRPLLALLTVAHHADMVEAAARRRHMPQIIFAPLLLPDVMLISAATDIITRGTIA